MGDLHPFVQGLIWTAAVVLPWIFGAMLARNWRMPEHGWRIGLLLFVASLGGLVTYALWPPKLGIDLRGGVILVYEIEEDQGAYKMDELVAAISKRVDPGNLRQTVIRPFGSGQIEIIIPEAQAAETDRIKTMISTSGLLEFRIVASGRDPRHSDIVQRAKASDKDRIYNPDDPKLLDARWVTILESKTERDPEASFLGNDQVTRRNSAGKLEVLVIEDAYKVDGAYFSSASAGVDQSLRPCVKFRFNAEGGQLFARLTADNRPRELATGGGLFYSNLAILLDGKIRTAPTINSVIHADGEITGNFSQDEVNDIVAVLKAGKLPAKLNTEPVSQKNIDPTLGQYTIDAGANSMILSVVLVSGFMLVYYRFAGLVACITLVLNSLLVLACMILIQAAFTLPGLAGFALTVGMAVDANVLINERMREELARGATFRMAIRNGFARATSAIVDSNLTTLITAIVLYVIGTDQVKGFAVTLFLGVLLNIFTAVFCGRVLFDVAERLRWVSGLKMMQFFKATAIDFIGLAKPAITVSLIVIVVGLAAVFSRGESLLDIDFSGGTTLEVVFKDSTTAAAVKDKVSAGDERLNDAVVQEVHIPGLKEGTRFKIDTSDGRGQGLYPDARSVENQVVKLFPGQLVTYSMTAGKVEELAPEAAKTPAEGKTPAEAEPAPAAAGRSRAVLTFTHAINYETVAADVARALEVDAKTRGTKFELSAPGFDPKAEQQKKTARGEWTLTLEAPKDAAQVVLDALQATLAKTVYFPATDNVGALVAGDTRDRAIYATITSLIFIIGYLWFRFSKVMFGLAAVVAVIHDVTVTLGALALSAYIAPYLGFLGVETFKINLTIISAFLTIIGYSLNDTIVMFDRLREIRGKNPDLTPTLVNASVNQTLSRTILTSLTVFIVVLIMYFAGGEGIHAFAFAMVVGTIAGTYSTVYIASPVLLWLHRWTAARQQRQRAAYLAPAEAT